MQNLGAFFKDFLDWANAEENINGIFLVGSYASDRAKETSDVDLIIITDEPFLYLTNNYWIEVFGKTTIVKDEDWGLLKTKRAYFDNGLEIEFNITTNEWMRVPADPETKKVLAEGNKILLDKAGKLKNFIAQI